MNEDQPTQGTTQNLELVRRMEAAERQVSRVASLALNCERRAQEDRKAAARNGITLGERHALLTRAENYDLTADGILRALDPTEEADRG